MVTGRSSRRETVAAVLAFGLTAALILVFLWTQYLHPPPIPLQPICAGGVTRPISSRQLVAALRQEAFSPQILNRSGLCIGTTIAEIDDLSDADARLHCALSRNAEWSTRRGRKISSPDENPRIVFANVDCVVGPREDVAGQEARLWRVIQSLVDLIN